MDTWKDGWKGTKHEQKGLIKFLAKDIKEEHFNDMTDNDFNKLFAEALCRNLVQSELVGMMKYIIEEEN